MSDSVSKPADIIIQAVEISKRFPYNSCGFQLFLEDVMKWSSDKLRQQLQSVMTVNISGTSRTFDSSHPPALRMLQVLRIMYNHLSEADKTILEEKINETDRDRTHEFETDVDMFCMLTENGLLPIIDGTNQIPSLQGLKEEFESRLAMENQENVELLSNANISFDSHSHGDVTDDSIEIFSYPREQESITVVDVVDSQRTDTDVKGIVKKIKTKREKQEEDTELPLAEDQKTPRANREKKACPSCSAGFFTNSGLKYHINTSHREDISIFDKLCESIYGVPKYEPAYLCAACVVAFESADRHKEHMDLHKKTPQPPMMCDYCSTLLLNPDTKEKHMGEHGHGLRTNSNHDPKYIATEIWCTSCSPNLVFTTEEGYFLHVNQFHNTEIFYFCKKCYVGSCESITIWNHIMSGTCSNPLVNERTLGMCVASDLHFQPIDEEKHRKMHANLFVVPHTCAGRSFSRFGSRFATCGEVEKGRVCKSLQNFLRYENRLAEITKNHSGTVVTNSYPSREYVDPAYTMHAHLRYVHGQDTKPPYIKTQKKVNHFFKVPPDVAPPPVKRTPSRSKASMPRVIPGVLPINLMRNSVPRVGFNFNNNYRQVEQSQEFRYLLPAPANPVNHPRYVNNNNTVIRTASNVPTSDPAAVPPRLIALRDNSMRNITMLRNSLAKEEAQLSKFQAEINKFVQQRSRK